MSSSGNVQKNITVVQPSFTLSFHVPAMVWLHEFELNQVFQRSTGFRERAVVHGVSLAVRSRALINSKLCRLAVLVTVPLLTRWVWQEWLGLLGSRQLIENDHSVPSLSSVQLGPAFWCSFQRILTKRILTGPSCLFLKGSIRVKWFCYS